ncbi:MULTISPECIES: DUF1109 domain-containing protein [Sphingomonas]|uniref:DUF1109 domain-containing protein n=1 Tax=Sphingomonas trueperi TaxID=53317 RepID=A0A7X5Y0J6_9SPHN|nr:MULTISPECIES: DUF1109 domain-containing protein [Sphingomonas]NJB98813.1 hypothetical protein [Sphingomonas trueperi]
MMAHDPDTNSTERLIAALSADVRAIPPRFIGRRIALGIAGGGVVSIGLVFALFGMRPDFPQAMFGFSFWMKWAYTLSLGLIAVTATVRLARPEGGSLRMLWPLALPILLLAALAIEEMIRTPMRDWLSMWLGGSWNRCPWRVLLLAVPIFLGLLWSFRKLAPTNLRAAGAAAGLAAGAWAATIYCLHCDEYAAVFVLTWYSLGILLATGLGALIGPRVLRW